MDPVTMMLVGSLGIQGASGLMGYRSAKKDAVRQGHLNRQNAELIKDDLNESFADSLMRAMQQVQAIKATLEDEQRARLAAQGTAITMAGEAGVGGNSVEMMMGDIDAQSNRFVDRLLQQNDWSQAAMHRERNAMQRDAKARIQGMARPNKPNLLAHALNTAGGMMNTGMNYNSIRG